jgi:Cd2+/Zn2+-exporting ATPase
MCAPTARTARRIPPAAFPTTAFPMTTNPAERSPRTFAVSGLDCAEEVATLRREVGPLAGGADNLAFDVLNGRMTVLSTAPPLADRDILAAVARTGMTAQAWQPRAATARQGDADAAHRRRLFATTVASALCVAAGFALHAFGEGGWRDALQLFRGHDGAMPPWPEAAAYGLAIVFGARFVALKAWNAARRLRPDMNLLMVVAMLGAVAINEWFEAATVALLFALSLALESWSVGRARRAVAALLDLAPPTVRVRTSDGAEMEVPAADVPTGTRFVVRPGERIGLDGRVVTGRSTANQAPITGESVPVAKGPGADVYAGTVNGEGVLEVESTRAAGDTTLAHIIHLVTEAHSRRAQVEQWVERFAHVYTPVVMVAALAIATIAPVAFAAPWSEWIYRGLVLLVIACPCALVISTPVSIVAALAAAARHGVLVKGGSYIELPARIRAIAFDKTGTLTRGEPEVVAVVPMNGHTPAELLERAAALEARSSHPLAKAILAHAAREGVTVSAADDARSLPGKGVTGRFRSEACWLGSHRYLVERGQETPEVTAQAEALEREGRTVVVIGNRSHVCGMIAVADTPRPGATEALRTLRGMGIERLVMLTGDNRVTADAIARALGVDEVRAELLPEDKVAAVEALVRSHGVVAMVGDGVNDAPAMARASFGVAMGAMGSDAAIETADIALMTDDLDKLPWLVSHARRTVAVIRQNIVFAIGVKAVFVMLTFAGVATLWGAIAADVGASLLVIANALRLLGAGPAVVAQTSRLVPQ